MNKRQTEKHFKRKWREALSKSFGASLGIKIKPSRLKLHITEDGDKYVFVGGFSGYSFKLEGVRVSCEGCEGPDNNS